MEIFVCGVGFWMFLAQKIQRFVSMESLRSLRSVALLMNIWYMNLIERNLHCYNQEPQHTCESRVRSWRGQIIQNVPVCPLPIPFNPLHASISACSNSVQQKLSIVVCCSAKRRRMWWEKLHSVHSFNGRFRKFRESSCALAAPAAEFHYIGAALAWKCSWFPVCFPNLLQSGRLMTVGGLAGITCSKPMTTRAFFGLQIGSVNSSMPVWGQSINVL